MKRCFWVNESNELYVKYHDEEWGEPKYNDQELYELLILEMFQAGLSWEIVLNKRANFRKSFDNFDIQKVLNYNEDKIDELMNEKEIIRNRRKIIASINNSKVFIEIQKEYGSFSTYIWSFTENRVIYTKGIHQTKSELSDKISKDLQKRGMSFVGTTIIYSYLQAIGIINDHDKDCYKYKKS